MEREQPTLGEQELEVLRFVTDRAPVGARDVVEHFAEAHGLARTTVLTMMERLRKKGYLTRKRRGGVFIYSPAVAQGEVLYGLVRHFVEKTLGGAASPVVAYLTKTRHLSDEDAAEIQRLLDELKAQKESDR
jgi:predicted transcriptional regulator